MRHVLAELWVLFMELSKSLSRFSGSFETAVFCRCSSDRDRPYTSNVHKAGLSLSLALGVNDLGDWPAWPDLESASHALAPLRRVRYSDTCHSDTSQYMLDQRAVTRRWERDRKYPMPVSRIFFRQLKNATSNISSGTIRLCRTVQCPYEESIHN